MKNPYSKLERGYIGNEKNKIHRCAYLVDHLKRNCLSHFVAPKQIFIVGGTIDSEKCFSVSISCVKHAMTYAVATRRRIVA